MNDANNPYENRTRIVDYPDDGFYNIQTQNKDELQPHGTASEENFPPLAHRSFIMSPTHTSHKISVYFWSSSNITVDICDPVVIKLDNRTPTVSQLMLSPPTIDSAVNMGSLVSINRNLESSVEFSRGSSYLINLVETNFHGNITAVANGTAATQVYKKSPDSDKWSPKGVPLMALRS